MTTSGSLSDSVLRILRSDEEAADFATYPFDFDITCGDHVEPVRLASGAALEGIAGDGAGGTYFLCHDASRGADRPVLYADSEGSACLIAENLAQAVELIVGLPYWRDFVHLEASDEAAVLAAVRESEDEYREDIPLIDEGRAYLSAALGLEPAPAPELIARLHAAVARTLPDFALLNEEGGRYAQL